MEIFKTLCACVRAADWFLFVGELVFEVDNNTWWVDVSSGKGTVWMDTGVCAEWVTLATLTRAQVTALLLKYA